MGQTQPNLKESEDYQLVQELAVGNIVKHNKSETLHFLKEYSFTAQEAYQNALNNHSVKLANKNEHVLNFLHFTTKSENSFCSAFHKIILIFEYIDYSLENEIQNRIKSNRPFNEKEMWSILCSCVLAAVHLIHCDGRMHCGLTPKDIRLNTNGCVKLLNQEMIGMETYHVLNEGVPKTLALTLLECMLMEKLTNEDESYLWETINEGLECSREMKDILIMMINKDCKFTELEEHLFKLVQDDESLASHSSTPLLKTESAFSSSQKYPRMQYDENNMKSKNKSGKNDGFLKELETDKEDGHCCLFGFNQNENEIEYPDDHEDEDQEQSEEFVSSPQQINSFILKERNLENELNSFHTFAPHDPKPKQINHIYSNANHKILIPHQLNHTENTAPILAAAQNLNVGTNNEIRKNENLFTDPELFSKIKNDLEEIKMRKSIGEVARYSHSQSHVSIMKSGGSTADLSVQNTEHLNKRVEYLSTISINSNSITPEASGSKTEKKNVVLEQKETQKEKIEKVKEAIHEFVEQRIESIKLVEFNQYKQPIQASSIHNIMNDPNVGLKKKKETSNTINSEKENTLEIAKQHAVCNDILDKKSVSNNRKEEKIENKSRTVAVQPIDPTQVSTFHDKDGLLDDFYRQSSQSSNRNEENQSEKIIMVNEKYNRGRYEGTKLNGKRHGHGTFYYIEGGKYVGNWKENKMHGRGVLYYPNQQVAYDGEWENDQLSGFGTLYNEEVIALRNPFDYRDWGEVEDYWVKYVGNFSEDNKEGQGKLYLVNGERFEGQFHEDKVDGDGILYRDGNCVKGKWRENKLIRIF